MVSTFSIPLHGLVGCKRHVLLKSTWYVHAINSARFRHKHHFCWTLPQAKYCDWNLHLFGYFVDMGVFNVGVEIWKKAIGNPFRKKNVYGASFHNCIGKSFGFKWRNQTGIVSISRVWMSGNWGKLGIYITLCYKLFIVLPCLLNLTLHVWLMETIPASWIIRYMYAHSAAV